jgi:toxin ParE1/3/4
LDRTGSQVTAERFVRRIKARCDKIGILPYGGRPRDDLERGLRTVAFERRAVVTYKLESNCVRIVNVFYGGRDYEALYGGSKKDQEQTNDS